MYAFMGIAARGCLGKGSAFESIVLLWYGLWYGCMLGVEL